MLSIAAVALISVSWDAQALLLLANPQNDQYVSKRDHLLMDNHPEIRASLKRVVVKLELLTPAQAEAFDKGFGGAGLALGIARETLMEKWLQDLENKKPKRKID